jgi:hypothetical protein
MQVRLGGNAGADVEELQYALGGKVRHRAAHEGAEDRSIRRATGGFSHALASAGRVAAGS